MDYDENLLLLSDISKKGFDVIEKIKKNQKFSFKKEIKQYKLVDEF